MDNEIKSLDTYNGNQYWSMFHKMNNYKKQLSNINNNFSFIKNDYLYGNVTNLNKIKKYGLIGNNIYFNNLIF